MILTESVIVARWLRTLPISPSTRLAISTELYTSFSRTIRYLSFALDGVEAVARESAEVTIVSTGEWCMAMELVGIETCYRHEEEIPPRFKPCPYTAAAATTTCRCCRQDNSPLSRACNSSCGNQRSNELGSSSLDKIHFELTQVPFLTRADSLG